MKKKRFYNNKKRGEKWTEEVKGRRINFADKYIDAGTGSDKFDNRRPTVKKPVFTRDNFEKLLKRLIIAVICFAIISAGYMIMDVNIQRNAMPSDYLEQEHTADLSEMKLSIGATDIPTLAMDGGVMLETVVDELQKSKFTSAAFDLKRSDGTVSYLSGQASVEAYGAVSSPANDMAASVKALLENDVLPIARVCCYKDNIAPKADSSVRLNYGGKAYKDSSGSTYLNPQSSSAYNYIKGIIEEASAMGITVFALDYCDLPDGLNEKVNGGFEFLSNKLYADLGDSVKLVEVKHITVAAKSAKAIKKELGEKAEYNNSSVVYYVSASDKGAVKQVLDSLGNINYVLEN
ncbi:MAG: putative glycoside hydrolase [Eubacterium sp.]